MPRRPVREMRARRDPRLPPDEVWRSGSKRREAGESDTSCIERILKISPDCFYLIALSIILALVYFSGLYDATLTPQSPFGYIKRDIELSASASLASTTDENADPNRESGSRHRKAAITGFLAEERDLGLDEFVAKAKRIFQEKLEVQDEGGGIAQMLRTYLHRKLIPKDPPRRRRLPPGTGQQRALKAIKDKFWRIRDKFLTNDQFRQHPQL